MMKESARVFAWAVALALGWGLLEASYRFMTVYHVHAFQRPVSGLNLFLAAILNYGILGVLFGLVAAVARGGVYLVSRGRRLVPGAFSLAVLVTLPVLVNLLVRLEKSLLSGVGRTHPLTLLTLLLLSAAGAVAGALVYRVLARPVRYVAARLSTGRLTRKMAWGLPLAVLAAFLLVGLVRGAAGGEPGAPASGTEAGGGEVAIGRSDEPVAEAAAGDRIGAPASQTEGAVVPETPAPADAARPNVILVSIETLRADHLNYMGYEKRVTSPNLDRLAREGLSFTRAYSQAPWTKPTMTSLFTSLYPSQHGVVTILAVLNRDVATLPKALARDGYHTASFYSTSYAWSPSFGFTESFGKFPSGDPYFISPISPRPFYIKMMQHSILTLALRITFPLDAYWYYDAGRINRKVEEWLDSRPPSPFLLHVHYLEPHEPYFDHPFTHLQYDPRAGWNLSSLLSRYDSEIRFVDGAINDLLTMLEIRGLLEGAIVIITADHGEEFLDHGGWGHRQHLHGELLHVPLILWGPGREDLPPGRVLDDLVSTVDIAPTILDLVGTPVPDGFAGQSVLPLQGGEHAERVVLSQVSGAAGDSHALLSGDWKLIKNTEGDGPPSLYNIARDPAEKEDLYGENTKLGQSLDSRLERMLRRLRLQAVDAGEETPPEEIREQMKALGYVD
jgi:arylsulfatase A-like enzyme